MHEARAIGRNEPGDDLGMKKIRKLFQEGGNVPEEIIWLNISSKIIFVSLGNLLIISLLILSKPGDVLVFRDEIAMSNSWALKGVSKKLFVWKLLGKESKKTVGGYISFAKY